MIPEIEESDLLFDEFIKIRRDSLILPNGVRYKYYSLVPPGSAVAVLAITLEGEYVLTQEYRHPIGKAILGTPGGYLDPKESPIEAGKRELLEETGFIAENYTLLGSFYPYPGISSQKLYAILAEGAKQQFKPQLEPAEIIVTLLKNSEETQALIKSGGAVDGILCSLLYLYGIHHGKATLQESRGEHYHE